MSRTFHASCTQSPPHDRANYINLIAVDSKPYFNLALKVTRLKGGLAVAYIAYTLLNGVRLQLIVLILCLSPPNPAVALRSWAAHSRSLYDINIFLRNSPTSRLSHRKRSSLQSRLISYSLDPLVQTHRAQLFMLLEAADGS